MGFLKQFFRLMTKEREKTEIALVPSEVDIRSSEYRSFLKSALERQNNTFVEKLCSAVPSIGVDFPSDMKKSIEEKITLGRLNVRTDKLFSAGLVSFVAGMVSGIPLVLLGLPSWLPVLLGFFFLYYVWSFPSFHASVLKTAAQDESIRVILLLSVYLRYSPNIEAALAFVAANSSGPLSTDILRVIWDVESGKYPRVSSALKQYSKFWIKWDKDFVRSLNMILNSLEKMSEEDRKKGIDDALENILTNTHMKMRMYTEKLTPKITLLHMGGIMLPVMGLLMFPLTSIFLSNSINSLYVAFGYTVFLPLLLIWYVYRILSTRPGTYSVPDVSKHPDCPPKGTFYVKVEGEKFAIPALPVALIVGLLLMLPGIYHFMNLGINYYTTSPDKRADLMYREANIFTTNCMTVWMKFGSLESRPDCQSGLNNVVSTFSVTLGLGVMAFLFLYLSSFQRAKISDRIRELEDEFKTGIFLVANYLSNGLPVEIAIRKAINQYDNLGIESSEMKDFLLRIDSMLRRQNITFDRAISSSGLLRNYPSPLIREVLDILKESVKKSPLIAGKIIGTIVKYLDNMKDVEVKIRESLESVRGSLRMQASLITPIITASVASLSTFILNILKSISDQIDTIMKNLNISGQFGKTGFMSMLVGDFSKVMPFTILQIIIGIYLIEIIYIMSSLLSGIDYGFDDSLRMRLAAMNLAQGLVTYFLVAIVSMLLFGSITPSSIVGG